MRLITKFLVILLLVLTSTIEASASYAGAAVVRTNGLGKQSVHKRACARHRVFRHKHHSVVPTYKAVAPKTNNVEQTQTSLLVEAVLVEVRLPKNVDESGINLAQLGAVALPNVAAASNAADASFVRLGGRTSGLADAISRLGYATVLASPRLLVLNGQRAEVYLGDPLPYQTTTTTKEGSIVEETKCIEVGTHLKVRPFFAADKVIRLEMHAEHTTGHVDAFGVPSICTQALTTNVMMPNEATIAMSTGPYCEIDADEGWKSLLSSIPYVGHLIPRTEPIAARKQLVVFVTLHLWKPSIAVHSAPTKREQPANSGSGHAKEKPTGRGELLVARRPAGGGSWFSSVPAGCAA
jgi:type II secretory pathway component GspD/PulD (secretin)